MNTLFAKAIAANPGRTALDVTPVLEGKAIVAKMLNRGEVVSKFAGPYPPNAVTRPVQHTDSTFILRVDLESLGVDTVAAIKVAKVDRDLKGDAQGLLTAIQTVTDPLPLVDGWAMLPDGTIAVVRGRDYHVDWFDPDGRPSSTSKMPFASGRHLYGR